MADKGHNINITPLVVPPIDGAENETSNTVQVTPVVLNPIPTVNDEKESVVSQKLFASEPINGIDNEEDFSLKKPIVVIDPIKEQENEQEGKYIVPLDGQWIPSIDPALIGKNFSLLTNMRYANGRPEGVLGMTKINTNIINATNYKVHSAFHFNKTQPQESHVIVQAFNSAETSSKVYENKTAIPGTGNFETTELWTDTSGSSVSQISDAPQGQMAYCNKVDTCIWGGDEIQCAAFISFDPSNTFSYDFTTRVRDTKTDSDSVATLGTTGAGIDSDTELILHLENNVTDSSPVPKAVTNNNVTFSTTYKIFGTYGAVFNGVNAYIGGGFLPVPVSLGISIEESKYISVRESKCFTKWSVRF